jgi:hypothetical protein
MEKYRTRAEDSESLATLNPAREICGSICSKRAGLCGALYTTTQSVERRSTSFLHPQDKIRGVLKMWKRRHVVVIMVDVHAKLPISMID